LIAAHCFCFNTSKYFIYLKTLEIFVALGVSASGMDGDPQQDNMLLLLLLLLLLYCCCFQPPKKI
jgi:hypothetical protein